MAGYFDGDGCPKVHVGVYAITLTVCWSDQDRDLLEHINRFLSQKEIIGHIGLFRRGKSVYYELTVGESGGNALRVLKGMLPYLDKKWAQVNAAIQYMESQISGNEFVKVLNVEVRAKRRSSSIRDLHLPFTKEQALQF